MNFLRCRLRVTWARGGEVLQRTPVPGVNQKGKAELAQPEWWGAASFSSEMVGFFGGKVNRFSVCLERGDCLTPQKTV